MCKVMRSYGSYDAYLEHQSSKLDGLDPIEMEAHDERYREELRARLEGIESGQTVLCLGARLGGEVRAFQDLGCFAVGLDVNPGDGNPYVLHGDFHDIQFPTSSVDVVFTNSLDHVLDFGKFRSQICRVLKPEGLFILEVVDGSYGPDPWDVVCWESVDDALVPLLRRGMEMVSRKDIRWPWRGEHVVLRVEASESVVVSYPKCGRTWLRAMIGKVLCHQQGLDDRNALDVGVEFVHAGSSYDGSASEPEAYAGHKVVFLTRDPRDVLVSHYFQVTRRETRSQPYPGSLSNFVRSKMFGIHRIAEFHRVWREGWAALRNVLLVRYEEMHADPRATLRRVLDFFGIEASDEQVDVAVEFAEFSRLRAREKVDYFGTPDCRPGKVDDDESYKLRKGKVGGYVDYLSADDIHYIEGVECAFHEFRREKKGVPGEEEKFERHSDFLVALINRLELEAVAEIGVHRGWTARRILSNCPTVTEYYMVDPWQEYPKGLRGVDSSGEWSQEQWEAVHRETKEYLEPFGERVQILRMESRDAAVQVPDDSLDLVFIDAIHTEDMVDLDIGKWYPKVKEGGFIAGHDWWDDGSDYARRFGGVQKGVLKNFDARAVRTGRPAANWGNVWLVEKKDIGRRILLVTEDAKVSWALRQQAENLEEALQPAWKPEIVGWGKGENLSKVPKSGVPIYTMTVRSGEQMCKWYGISREWQIVGWHSIREIVRYDYLLRTEKDQNEKETTEILLTLPEDYTVGDEVRAMLSKYAATYCFSERMLKILDDPSVVLLHPCVNTDKYFPVNCDRSGPLVVGWAGNAQREYHKKGIDLLKRIIASIDDSPSLVYDNTASKGLGGGIPSSDMPEFYRSIDVLIVTAVEEGTPRVVLEAGASGVPVVSTPCGIVPEYIVDGETGYIVGEREPEAFLEKLEHLAANRDVLDRMCQNIRDVTVREWSVEARRGDYLKLFESFPTEEKSVVVHEPGYRFHLLGLAHLPTHVSMSPCAFSQKIVKLARMLKSLGHHVFFYGVEGSEVECDEFVQVLSEAERREVYGDYDWWSEFYKHSGSDDAQKTFNERTSAAIKERGRRGDFLLCTMGNYQKPIADSLKGMGIKVVEPGVGYRGYFAPYRCFESYAWMHYLYGRAKKGDGNWYDAVIPNYYDPEDFPFEPHKGDYALYMGRIIKRKGVEIAVQVTRELGMPLVLAGQGSLKNPNEGLDIKDAHVTFLGAVGPEERKGLLGKARVVFVPTYYIEPFGGVAVEAAFCGTPVVTTDWGAMSETVLPGVTGYRCRTFDDFVWAVRNIDTIEPQACRDWALANYSMDRVRWMFEEYFGKLDDLDRRGWYELHPEREDLDWLRKEYPLNGSRYST